MHLCNLQRSTEVQFCVDPKLQIIILALLNGIEFRPLSIINRPDDGSPDASLASRRSVVVDITLLMDYKPWFILWRTVF
jgi:hypothetical protein